MRKYPLIGDPPVLSAKDGVVFDPAAAIALDIAGGLEIANVGSGSRTTGRLALVFVNTTGEYGDDLVVTPAVTATLTEVGGALSAIATTLTIPPGGFGISGPFGRQHEDIDGNLSFAFTGDEGGYYAIYVR